jgi:hypothetical protein
MYSEESGTSKKFCKKVFDNQPKEIKKYQRNSGISYLLNNFRIRISQSSKPTCYKLRYEAENLVLLSV